MAESSTHESSTFESSTYEERHRRAAETFAVFVPEVDPERVAGSLAKRLGALGTFAFDVVGEMWARPELSRRDRSLIVVSTLAAQARDEELELHTGVALRNGLTRVEIEEIVVTVAAYAGFPAAMAASRRVDAALLAAEGVETLGDRTPAAAKSDAERDRAAADVYKVVSGGRGGTETTTDLAYLSDAIGGVGVLAYRWVSARSGLATSWRVVTDRSSSSRSSSRSAASPSSPSMCLPASATA